MNIPITNTAPPWVLRLNEELDVLDAEAMGLVQGLTVDDLNRKPNPGAWSVGQCVQHLCITNEVYLPPIVSALEGKPNAPVREIRPGWFARWFIRTYIEPSPQTKRASAPKKIAPGPRVELSIVERLLATNRNVREVIARAAAHDVNRIRFKNPFIPVLRSTVGTGLQIICSHQRRHLLQAARVKQSLHH